MALRNAEECDGRVKWTYTELDGRRYPPFAPDTLRHVSEIQAQPDDVLLVTYPRSGTHWVSDILRFLVCGTTDLPQDSAFVHFLDMTDRDVINELPKSSPRYFCTHFCPEALSPEFLRQNSKLIHVTRNPRDVAVSFYEHHMSRKRNDLQGEWKDYLPLLLDGKMAYGSWFNYTKEWEKCIKENPENRFLLLSYEGLKQDPLGNIKRIADFIGINHSEEFLKEVETKTSFKSMVETKQKQKAKDLYMYRKGQIGDWKNHFTVAMSEMFNDIFEKEMVGTDAYKLYSHTVGKTED